MRKIWIPETKAAEFDASCRKHGVEVQESKHMEYAKSMKLRNYQDGQMHYIDEDAYPQVDSVWADCETFGVDFGSGEGGEDDIEQRLRHQ